jgi:hypothetical protein
MIVSPDHRARRISIVGGVLAVEAIVLKPLIL